MLPHVFDTLRREPAVAITLAYLLVATAGIFYNYWFYRAFGIPVLTLSQISDFLVAGLQQPMALVLMLSTVPLCWVMDKVNARSRRKHLALIRELRALPTTGHWQAWRLRALEWRVGALWYTQLGYVAVVAVYGWAFVGLYARARADAVQRGEGAQVEVWLNGEHDALAAPGQADWSYLGAVANYVFVYDRAERRAVVLPVNAIARMQPGRQASLPEAPVVPAPGGTARPVAPMP